MAIGRGLFVSIEGGEGAGKSVQARALVAHFERRRDPVRFVREPGGTPLGERIREVLLFAKDVTLTPETEALLFSAARAQLTREVIGPALEGGTHVVADRFFDSTLAYQGFGHRTDVDGIRAVTRFAVGSIVPDLTVLLDLPVEVALARTRRRSQTWDRFESHDEGFHMRVREGYLALAREDPHRWIIVDAARPELEIARQVAGRVDQELAHRSNRIATR